MATFNPVGASAPSAVTISAKSTSVITSLTLSVTPGTESTLTFTSAIVAFRIQTRDGSKLTIATSSGNTATDDKFEFTPGNCYAEEFLTTNNAKTYYVASNIASTVIQILSWT